MLNELTSKIGARVSGSPEAARAVKWVHRQLEICGATNVSEVPCMVPHWTRGKGENAELNRNAQLSICALGGSVATPPKGIEAEVIEVKSLKEAEELGERGRGKIVFFNRPFDPTLPATFAAYGGANDQRVGGATAAGLVVGHGGSKEEQEKRGEWSGVERRGGEQQQESLTSSSLPLRSRRE